MVPDSRKWIVAAVRPGQVQCTGDRFLEWPPRPALRIPDVPAPIPDL